MTLAQAESISSLLPEVLASKDRAGFCRRSQLGNWSMVDIFNAFALMIAKNRQLVAQDANARRLCNSYAEKAGALLVSLRMVVIPDADADRLSKLNRDSAEFQEARQKVVIGLLEDRSPEWQRFLKLETLDAFNNFCWTLDSEDPDYWPKVHARLNVPFKASAPESASAAQVKA